MNRRMRCGLASISVLSVGVAFGCSSFQSGSAVEPSEAGPDSSSPIDSSPAETSASDGGCSTTAPTSTPFATSDGGAASFVRSDDANVFWLSGNSQLERASLPDATDRDHALVGPLKGLVVLTTAVAYLVDNMLTIRPKASFSSAIIATSPNWQGIFGGQTNDAFIGNTSDMKVDLVSAQGVATMVANGWNVTEGMSVAGTVVLLGTEKSQPASLSFYSNTTEVPVGLHPLHIAFDGVRLFYSDQANVSAADTTVDGGDPHVLAAQQDDATDLQLTSKYIYWRTPNGIRRTPLDGGCVEPVTTTAAASYSVSGNIVFVASGSAILQIVMPQ